VVVLVRPEPLLERHAVETGGHGDAVDVNFATAGSCRPPPFCVATAGMVIAAATAAAAAMAARVVWIRVMASTVPPRCDRAATQS
jgi:hypothetical protein